MIPMMVMKKMTHRDDEETEIKNMIHKALARLQNVARALFVYASSKSCLHRRAYQNQHPRHLPF
jgi:hypothetical protein